MKEEAFYRQLVYRYQHNQASDEELELFFQLLKEGKLEPYLTEAMDATAAAETQAAPVRKIFPWRMAAAAVIVMLLAGGAWIWFNGRPKQTVAVRPNNNQPADIAPGGNKAVLILADGKQIILDSARNGLLTEQGNTAVNKKDAQLVYNATNNGQPVINTISTPRGGQFQVVLPDGSKVWLNAASSLRFPTAFTGNERKVELKGEAYFEIAKNMAKPFIVDVNGGASVEVLGTNFNINAYTDEEAVKTTLLEGSVKLRSAILKPGQQAALKNNRLTINDNPDLDEVLAWKNGYFRFNDASIAAIMRQAARWYNIDVEYTGNVAGESFSGAVPRSENISSLLKILELTKTIRCTIKDRKIIIQPYSSGN